MLSALAGHQRRWVQPLRGFDDGDWALLHSFQTFAYPQLDRVVFDHQQVKSGVPDSFETRCLPWPTVRLPDLEKVALTA